MDFPQRFLSISVCVCLDLSYLYVYVISIKDNMLYGYLHEIMHLNNLLINICYKKQTKL